MLNQIQLEVYNMPYIKNDLISTSLIESFSKNKPIQTIETLLNTCNCSMRTLRRRIKAYNIICSYNKNSIFYTVPSLAEFDQYGIWHYKEASFSKWGNLFETIVQLIDHSDMGYTSHELGEILKIKVYDPLRVLSLKNRIKKLKIQIQNTYFSAKEDIARQQIDNRNVNIEKALIKKQYSLPDAEIIISILVEIILDRTATSQQICNRIKTKGIMINHIHVEAVIEHYQLKKKLSNKSASSSDS